MSVNIGIANGKELTDKWRGLKITSPYDQPAILPGNAPPSYWPPGVKKTKNLDGIDVSLVPTYSNEGLEMSQTAILNTFESACSSFLLFVNDEEHGGNGELFFPMETKYRAQDCFLRYLRTHLVPASEVAMLACACCLLAAKVEVPMTVDNHEHHILCKTFWNIMEPGFGLALLNFMIRSTVPSLQKRVGFLGLIPDEIQKIDRFLVFINVIGEWELKVLRALRWRVGGPTAYQWGLAVMLAYRQAEHPADPARWFLEAEEDSLREKLDTLFLKGLPSEKYPASACGQAAAVAVRTAAMTEQQAQQARLHLKQFCSTSEVDLNDLMNAQLPEQELVVNRAPLGPSDVQYGACIDTPTAYGEGFYTQQRCVVVADAKRWLLKRIPVTNPSSIPAAAVAEVSTLRLLESCPFIITLQAVKEELPRHIGVLLEEAQFNLYEWKNSAAHRGRLAESEVCSIFCQILQALQWAHSMGVVHNNLTPTNILMVADSPRVADFGVATKDPLHSSRRWTQEGSRAYMAPEALMEYDKCCEAVDLWAAGCILGELLLDSALSTTVHGFFHRRLMKPSLPLLNRPENISVDNILEVLGKPSLTEAGAMFYEDMQSYLGTMGSRHAHTVTVPRGIKSILSGHGNNSVSDDMLNLMASLLKVAPDARITAKQALHHRLMAPYYRAVAPKRDHADIEAAETHESYRQLRLKMQTGPTYAPI